MTIDPQRETLDAILGGALTIVQPVTGYRFSIDAILLAYFAQPRNAGRVLDLGAGCGVVAATIARAYRPKAVVALELQPHLVELARRNACLNRLDNLTSICGDLRAQSIYGAAHGSFDYMVVNPPYRAQGRGRESPHRGRRLARTDVNGTLGDFIAAALRFLTDHGKLAIVFTATRTAELISELKAHMLEPKRLRFVHPYADSLASTVLIEAHKHGGLETTVEPPLIIWMKPGIYTAEAERILSGAWLASADEDAATK